MEERRQCAGKRVIHPRGGMRSSLPGLLVVILVLVGATGMAATQAQQGAAQPQAEAPEKCDPSFERMDVNHDGRLTLDEMIAGGGDRSYAARSVTMQKFKQMDTNHDIAVSKEEYCAVFQASPPPTKEQCDQKFAAVDTDHNGTISLDEYIVSLQAQTYGTRRAAKVDFLALDRNADGLLSKEEYCNKP